MKMKSKRIFALFLALLTFVLPLQALAAEDTASLTIQYTVENKPVEGAAYDLYLVGSAVGSVVTLNSDFAGAQATFEDTSADALRTAAQTLSAYAIAQKVKPVQSGKTDANGSLTFSGLPEGVYLAVGENTQVGEETYSTLPILITLPEILEDGSWVYDVATRAKTEKLESPLTLRVIKEWSDKGYEKNRPSSIQVTLYKDKAEYETITLNAENRWSYTWNNLDKSAKWSVLEKEVPKGYTVSTDTKNEGQQTVITLTNTYKTATPSPSPSATPTLPRTGQLWWPVPLLAGAGILCLAVGMMRRKHTG